MLQIVQMSLCMCVIFFRHECEFIRCLNHISTSLCVFISMLRIFVTKTTKIFDSSQWQIALPTFCVFVAARYCLIKKKFLLDIRWLHGAISFFLVRLWMWTNVICDFKCIQQTKTNKILISWKCWFKLRFLFEEFFLNVPRTHFFRVCMQNVVIPHSMGFAPYQNRYHIKISRFLSKCCILQSFECESYFYTCK